MREDEKDTFDYLNTDIKLLASHADKRVFLSLILHNPTVNRKKPEFTIAFPFNLVLELADRPNWLHIIV